MVAPDAGASAAAAESESAAPRDIRALVFDCDGTLVNSMEFFFVGWTELCALPEYQFTFTKKRFYEVAGTPIDEIVKMIMRENGRKEEDITDAAVKAFLDKKYEVVKSMKARGLAPGEISCVCDIVRENFNRGAKVGDNGRLPMAVASSGDRLHVLGDLERNDLLKYFLKSANDPEGKTGALVVEVEGEKKPVYDVVTVDDVPAGRGKPNPDLFLLAAERLGIAPDKCRGFEDADLGMEALKRAGMEAVDVRLFEGHPTQAGK